MLTKDADVPFPVDLFQSIYMFAATDGEDFGPTEVKVTTVISDS
jgi:hypothetical protein